MKYALIILLTIAVSKSNGQWTEQTTFTNNFAQKFSFITDDLGYSLGTSGNDEHLLKTSNGGISWTEIQLPITNESISDFHFYEEDHGVITYQASSDPNEPILIYQTIDDGNSWTNITPDTIFGQYWIPVVHFVNDNVGFMGGGNFFYKTVDGGISWTSHDVNPPSAVFTSYFIQDIHFYDEDNGIMGFWDATFFYGGAMFVTSNGGDTWKETYLPKAGTVTGKVVQVSETTSYAAPVKWGSYGFLELYKTINSGATWDTIYVPDTTAGSKISDYDFYDENYGVVVVEVNFGNEYILYSTIDGGQTWIHCGNLDNLGNQDQDIQITENTGYITGEFESFYKLNEGYGGPLTIIENNEYELVAYPNPVESGGVIHFKNAINLKDIQIINVLGEVQHKSIVSNSSLQLSNLTPGIYFIQTTNDFSNRATRLIVE